MGRRKVSKRLCRTGLSGLQSTLGGPESSDALEDICTARETTSQVDGHVRETGTLQGSGTQLNWEGQEAMLGHVVKACTG
eukprot:scaffold234775_cov18-Tisochrysis_lutea.AAC.1